MEASAKAWTGSLGRPGSSSAEGQGDILALGPPQAPSWIGGELPKVLCRIYTHAFASWSLEVHR